MHDTHNLSILEVFLNKCGASAHARDVLRLSDMYQKRDAPLSQIWANLVLQRAYLAYFMPLNMLRLEAVVREALSLNFFNELQHLIELGSGSGALDLVLSAANVSFHEQEFIEVSPAAQKLHQDILMQLQIASSNKVSHKKWLQNLSHKIQPQTLGAFSYSLNELAQLPSWAYDCEALLIVEPSTQFSGRRLQMLRKPLAEAGFHLWAPCTHQKRCPLLLHSKTDWCHQRIHVELPQQLQKLEAQLPMKNQTLTYSYLLARKAPPPQGPKIRVIGDTLYERGKVKQAICRGEEREFFSWLTRFGVPQPIPRGTRLSLPPGAEQKGGEIRLPKP